MVLRWWLYFIPLFMVARLGSAVYCEPLAFLPNASPEILDQILPEKLSLEKYQKAKVKVQHQSAIGTGAITLAQLAEQKRAASVHDYLAWLSLIDPELDPYIVKLVQSESRLRLPRGLTWRELWEWDFSYEAQLAERLSKLARIVITSQPQNWREIWGEILLPQNFVKKQVQATTHQSRSIQGLIAWFSKYGLSQCLRSTQQNPGTFEFNKEYQLRFLFTQDLRVVEWVGRLSLSLLSFVAIAEGANNLRVLPKIERELEAMTEEKNRSAQHLEELNEEVDDALSVILKKTK